MEGADRIYNLHLKIKPKQKENKKKKEMRKCNGLERMLGVSLLEFYLYC